MTHFTRSILNRRTIDYKAMTCASDYIAGSNSNETIEYDKTSCVDAVQLIRQVKKYPELYNSQVEGYTDFAAKELIWEKINEAIFPAYKSLPVSTQNVIKQTVRRRWKSARNLMAKDVRTKITKKNYQHNTNPLLAEMQFLLPHIKSIYAKVAQQNKQNTSNVRSNFAEENTMFQDIANVAAEEDETTDMNDQKPYHAMRQDRSICSRMIEPDSTPNHGRQEPESTSNNEHRDPYNNSYCLTECNAGEFSPTLAYTAQELGSITESGQSQPQSSTTSAQQTSDNRRKRSSTNDKEFQDKLLELVSKTIANRDSLADRETEDEDRMFMLSLVSDLKSLPSAKKMLIKAEIVTAIARSAQVE